MIYFQNNRKL